MENPFQWKVIEHEGKKVHEGVYALIQRERKFLLIERRFYPFGYSFVSGHVNKGEEPEQAVTREVKEELRLAARNPQFLFTAEQDDICPMLLYKHFNYVYSVEVDGEPKKNFEAKRVGWFTPETIRHLKLTDFSRGIFERLLIL